ncbi:hypothetical protein A3A46_03680 [Candidatus Roizmanbacteria bacterium RIFCSPLOWO2_01_FULL_37_13]|uniref:Uncharacterized protein n=1 Tax=Candidatus Roizmanbacteria bacterium RIFCSPHIGHO2_02_FULL_38_11 TaxID=1802039 RepID=A0A1F7H047_9BACT|nr:MAG: hypothetical protein A3C25_02570 [Candidatus Roizmanbacteria bacterium RIFCSPHIGHO2_02_FULL_38_11]OGK42018.1 MAG: hypothetical protein A3A46_03680 [Candidatus Roizmanbacteria bacterium RIFCSPLOWO2_01_FULL_37_13]
MIKTLIFIFGLLIFFSGIFLGGKLKKGEKQALSLDGKKTSFAIIGDEGPPPCSWEVSQPERVMSESKSQAILINAKNSNEKSCETIVSLRAPGFDISPYKDEQKISLAASGKGSLSWILTPRKSGTFEIAVSDIINTKIFGITVTDMFGLNANQAKVFSIIGSLFGPMFTIPWWLDKWHRRKHTEEDSRKNLKNV